MVEKSGNTQHAAAEQDADGFVDITSDGGLKKKVLTEGSGNVCPRSGVTVKVHYTGTLSADGDKFDSSRDRGEHFLFNIGRGDVVRGWDEGVATFREGERSILRCSADYGYGASGHPPRIPGGAALDFDIELFSWEETTDNGQAQRLIRDPNIVPASDGSSDDSDDSWDEMDYDDRDFLPQETEACPEENRAYVFEDRLERAEELRVEANALMKKLEFVAARLTYRRAYYHVDFDELQTFDMQDKHLKMIDDVKLPILLNLAQATLKIAAEYAAMDGKQKSRERSAKSVMVYCNAALKIAPDNAKALYRKGLAYEQLGDFEDAYDWLKRARTAMGDTAKSDKGFQQNLRRVREKAREEHAERAKVWKGKLPPVEKKPESNSDGQQERRTWKQLLVEEWPTMFGVPVIAGALGIAMYRDYSYNGFY